MFHFQLTLYQWEVSRLHNCPYLGKWQITVDWLEWHVVYMKISAMEHSTLNSVKWQNALLSYFNSWSAGQSQLNLELTVTDQCHTSLINKLSGIWNIIPIVCFTEIYQNIHITYLTYTLNLLYMPKNSLLFFPQAKHLQFVSGVDAISFWLATYSWDFINYLFPMLGIIIMFAAFQVNSLKEDLGTIFLLLVIIY